MEDQVPDSEGQVRANGPGTAAGSVGAKYSYKTPHLVKRRAVLQVEADLQDDPESRGREKVLQLPKYFILISLSPTRMLVRHLEQYEVYPQVESHVTSSSLPRLRVGDSFSPPPSFPLSTSLPRSMFASPTPDPNETGLVTVGYFQERNLQIILVIKLSGNIFSTNLSGRFFCV